MFIAYLTYTLIGIGTERLGLHDQKPKLKFDTVATIAHAKFVMETTHARSRTTTNSTPDEWFKHGNGLRKKMQKQLRLYTAI